MKALEAPSVVKNAGRSGKIASLETSVKRLTSPRPITVLGRVISKRGGELPSLRAFVAMT
jgi:hypothetical protein